MKPNKNPLKAAFSMLLIMLVFHGCINKHARKHTDAYGPGLYEQTPAEKLAKAVYDDDIPEIKKIITANKSLLKYEEPTFISTILEWAIFNGKAEGVEELLRDGANPNYSTDGFAAIHAAAAKYTSSEYLKLVLKYGGNPNLLILDSVSVWKSETPLTSATRASLENVKILIEAGAEINKKCADGTTPLFSAAVYGKYDIVLYLIRHGADVSQNLSPYNYKDTLYLVDLLRRADYPKKTKEYKLKMEIIKELSAKGIEY